MNEWFFILMGLTISGLVTGLAAIRYGIPLYVRWRWVQTIDAYCRSTQTVVLTFDDGPCPRTTPRVLNCLMRYGYRGTFFPTGFRIRRYPDLMTRCRVEGHEIGAHSDQHLHAWRIPNAAGLQDVVNGLHEVEPWCTHAKLFRPPYGKCTWGIMRTIKRAGWSLAWWTLDSGDSEFDKRGPGELVERVLARGGGVILFHDLDASLEREQWMLESLELLSQTIDEHGFRVITLGALLDEMDGRDIRIKDAA